MKKLIIVLIVICSILLVSGCKKKDMEKIKENNKDNKILIVYFSRKGENYNVGKVDIGNTALVASYISEKLGAKSFEIEPVKPYPESYDEAIEVATKEKENKERPKIKNNIDDFDNYDTIFIGYPIWWGDLPMIMYTFLESYNFDNKNIYLFNTHEGSGNAGTKSSIKKILKNANVSDNNFVISGTDARSQSGQEKTNEWLDRLNL